MTWVLDEPRRLLSDSAQTFLRERAPVAHLRALRDSADKLGYSPALWHEFAAQGYSAVLVPEAHGGLGLGVAEASLIAEQMGHTLTPSPFFSTAVLAAWLLKKSGNAGQQARWLPRIAYADTVLAVAIDEHSRHQLRPPLLTSATRGGASWRLSGSKLMVQDGHVAEALLVAASGESGVGWWLVPANAPGVRIERTPMVDAHNAARVQFDNVVLPSDSVLAAPGEGGALLEGVLDVGRVVVAAQLLGLADEVFGRTLDYLKQRRQFDRAIGEFQALQHRAAELYCDLELTRAILRQALQAIDAGATDSPLRVAQAKARACASANRAVQEGVQMHGGIGMTDELEIGFFMKRARTLQVLFGDAAFHIDRAAQFAGY